MDEKKAVDGQQSAPADVLVPGQTISPRQAPQAELPKVPAEQTAEQPTTLPEVASQPDSPAPAAATPTPEAVQPPEQPQDFASAGQDYTDQPPEIDAGGSVTWSASEYIAHDKGGGWYLLLLAGAVVVAGLVFFITKDWVSASVIILAGITLAGYASRKPRQLEYAVSQGGLSVGAKQYSYSQFRSFSVVPEGAFPSIVFMPLKRFGVQTTIYYDPKDEDRILGIISTHLPHEPHRTDVIDGMMRRIRF